MSQKSLLAADTSIQSSINQRQKTKAENKLFLWLHYHTVEEAGEGSRRISVLIHDAHTHTKLYFCYTVCVSLYFNIATVLVWLLCFTLSYQCKKTVCVRVVKLVIILHSVQADSQCSDTWSCLRESGLCGTPLTGLPDSLTPIHTRTCAHTHPPTQDLCL